MAQNTKKLGHFEPEKSPSAMADDDLNHETEDSAVSRLSRLHISQSYAENVSPLLASSYVKPRSESVHGSLSQGNYGSQNDDENGDDDLDESLVPESRGWETSMDESISSLSLSGFLSQRTTIEDKPVQRSFSADTSTDISQESSTHGGPRRFRSEGAQESFEKIRKGKQPIRRPASAHLFDIQKDVDREGLVVGSPPPSVQAKQIGVSGSSSLVKSQSGNPFVLDRTRSPGHQSVPRMPALMENFDPRMDSYNEETAEQKLLGILDGAAFHLNEVDTTLTFQQVREQLAKRGVQSLAVITVSHFLGERVKSQYHETLTRVKAALGSSSFHILVVGFGPEKFIPSFCTNLGLRSINILDDVPLSDERYAFEKDIFVVSDSIRYIYNIMTAYQVGREASHLTRGTVATSSTYSKTFRMFSRLTAPTTTGSGRQFLAWMVLDLKETKVLHFEIDSETCKY